MAEYGGVFKDIMRLRYGKTKPTQREEKLFEAVSYLGESFNSPTTISEDDMGENGKTVIRRNDYSDTDHVIVFYEGNDVFHITLGFSDKIINYIPGEWEDKILKRYKKVHP